MAADVRSGRRRRALLVAVTLIVAAAAGCGSTLDDETLRATNGALQEAISSGRATGGGVTGAGATGTGGLGGSTAGEGQASSGAGGSAGGISGTGAGGTAAAGGAGAGRSGAGQGPAGPLDPIKFGSVGTQSGLIGAIVADAPAAVRAFVADVNARGGVNGHPIEVLIEDDGGDPGKALAIARRQFEEQGVLAYFGIFGAATMHTVTAYAEQNNIPVIGSVPHPSIEFSPVFFVPETTNVDINRGHLTALVNLTPIRKVATFACREADSCPKGLRDMREFAPLVGVEIVHEAQVSLAQPDMTAEMLAARNAGAEAVIGVIDAATISRAIKSAHRQGWYPQFVSGPAVYNSDLFQAAGEDAEGLIAFGSVAPYTLSSAMGPYRDAMATHVPNGKLGDFGAGLWAGGKLLEAIGPALDTQAVSREQLFAALRSLRDETLGGITPPLNFPEQRTETTNACVYPVRVEGGQWTAPLGDQYVCNPR